MREQKMSEAEKAQLVARLNVIEQDVRAACEYLHIDFTTVLLHKLAEIGRISAEIAHSVRDGYGLYDEERR